MQQSKTVGHVDAVFGGKRVRFELARDVGSVLALEQELGSLMAVGLRLERNDGWTLAEVRTILARAHAPAKGGLAGIERPFHVAPGLSRTPPAPPVQRGVDPLTIDPTLSAAPTGTYRALAVLVLEALMLGVPPERAVWDERQSTILAEAAA